MSNELTPKARDLLDAVGRVSIDGQWVKRADIARSMGKTQLNGADQALLEMLAAMGLIQQQEVATKAPSGKRYEYRVIESGN